MPACWLLWRFRTGRTGDLRVSPDFTSYSRLPRLPLPITRVVIPGRPLTFLNPSLLLWTMGMITQGFLRITNSMANTWGPLGARGPVPFSPVGTPLFSFCLCRFLKASSHKGCLRV